MPERIETDLCVIGAGSAGLSVAAGAVQMGARVVLVEKGAMGGDCLNYGCVPSKALLAAGRRAAALRDAERFGIRSVEPEIDFERVHRHVDDVIAAIAPNDSQDRFEALGCTVLRAVARFTGPGSIAAGETEVTARRFVIATGSHPFVPPIPGLDTVPFLTNETIFGRTEKAAHLIVLGGGPIGVEMAQAHRHLGSKVTVVEMDRLLARDDADLAAVVVERLRSDGVGIHERAKVVEVSGTPARGVSVTIETDGARRTLAGSHLLVAAGRAATVSGLDLEKAGIAYARTGIEVDARLRTTNRRIFAIGDCAGGPQFTHVAGYHAGIVIRNALFRLPARVDYRALPRVTYTSPELAQVGLTEAEARQRHDRLQVLHWPFTENDRAQVERDTGGFVKVVAGRRGRILGAGVVGAHAGEMIALWGLAIGAGLKLGAVAGVVAPYPTFGEASKRAAGAYFTPALFSERTRRLVRFLLRLP